MKCKHLDCEEEATHGPLGEAIKCANHKGPWPQIDKSFDGFRCIDRLIIEPIADVAAPSGVRLVTSSSSNEQLQIARVVVGTSQIPAGSEVLVQSGVMTPGQHRLLGDRRVYIAVMAQVEAWRKSNRDISNGPLMCPKCGTLPWWNGTAWVCSMGTQIEVEGPPPPKCPQCQSFAWMWDVHKKQYSCSMHGLINSDV